MSDVNPYSPPASSVEIKNVPSIAVKVPPGEPEGLGGWLVLVCIGLILSPLRLGALLARDYLPIFRDGTWESLIDSTSAGYHPPLAALMLFELVINVAFIAFSIWLLILFFRKSSRFPKMAIVLYAANAAFVLADTVTLSAIGFEAFDFSSMREIMRSLISAAIWVPYMLLSRRVKNTFVEE